VQLEGNVTCLACYPIKLAGCAEKDGTSACDPTTGKPGRAVIRVLVRRRLRRLRGGARHRRYDFGALAARIGHAARQIGASRVSVDSLDAVFTRFADPGVVRHELARITAALEKAGVTAVITAERANEYDHVSRYGVEEFVLDNVIILRNVLAQERRRRTVEIVKMRGAPHRTGEWLFTIDPRDGLVVIPLAFLVPPFARASQVRVSSGNTELDQMCGGGFFKDARIAGELASLTDTTITLRYFEHAGEIQRAIAVMQTRGSAHDPSIRQVTIDGDGMHIGEPISGPAGILSSTTSLPAPGWPADPPGTESPQPDG
jgi:KaiC/GvpD/RAD55 family RecA-like ATPase